MGLPGPLAREVRSHAAGSRWRHVHGTGAQRCDRAGCRHRPRLLDLFTIAPFESARPCCGRVNRGLAILGDTLFMGTIDAHLIAHRRQERQATVERPRSPRRSRATRSRMRRWSIKDKVIVGTAGGEYGIRGFIAAYDVHTGKEVWHFYTIPGPGEPGHETWAGDSWKHGGGSVWVTGSYDPRTQPDLLGNRQSRPRLERRSTRQATICTPIPWSRSMPTRAS